MKPLRLEFCGINSFSERAEIDFTKLARYGIFGIFGDTGSGKSTILDSIHFAIYGEISHIPRGSMQDVINYKSASAYVCFEFEIVYEGERRVFRVERELKRKSGANHTVKVYERRDGALFTLAESVSEAKELLKKIIGLEQSEFEKCIALPQGEFAQFVKTGGSNRLKLIANLFDLQAYGEQLAAKNKAHLDEWKEKRSSIEGCLSAYTEITPEGNAQLKEEIEADSQREQSLKAELGLAREEEKRISAIAQKRAEYDLFLKEFARLQNGLSEQEQLRGELEKLERAEEYLSAEKKRERAQTDYALAVQTQQRAEENLAQAEKKEEESRSKLASYREHDLTEELTARYVLAQSLGQLREQIDGKTKELVRVRRAYREELELYPAFSYEDERNALEEEKQSLGEGDLLDFAVERGKESLFREEYGQFAKELTALTERHPEITGDTAELIARYTALSSGNRESFERLKADYEAREKRRKQIEKSLLDLEKKNGEYRRHQERLSNLQTQGKALHDEVETLSKNVPEDAISPERAKAELDAYRAEVNGAQRAYDDAVARGKELTAVCAEARAAVAAAQAELVLQTESVDRVKVGFKSLDEAKTLLSRYGNAAQARKSVEDFFAEYQAAIARKGEYEKEDFSEGGEENLLAVREKLRALDGEYQALSQSLAVKKSELARKKDMLVQKKALQEDLERAIERYNVYEQIRKLVSANKFVEFLAEEYLQNIALGASGRLLSLTDGRYFLKYEEGNFSVGDNFNGGMARGTHTLSGGETFLVSLSLALALSAEICAKSLRPIEFFFLDEGFGTLDEKLVDTVMDSLERLKNENFSVGIISHVEELKHRIESKLLIEKASEVHGSQIHAT